MKQAKGYRLIFGYLGIFMVAVGIICLLPLFALFAYNSEVEYAKNFYIPGLASIVVGIGLSFLLFKREKQQLGKHQDSVLLVLIWLVSVLVASVPFVMLGMSFTDSVFETASGFATIGLTVFNRFDLHVYTLYRALLALFGGVGLVLVVTSAISDRYGLKLYTSEGHNDKLMPNLVKSARLILGIYLAYILIGSLALWLAGMPIFDAICHSISALATGGFSSRAGGFSEAAAGGNVLALEIIICVLMVLGSTNFLIHLFLLTGKWKRVFRDCEFRLFGILILIGVPLFILSVFLNNNSMNFGDAARYGAFTFFSAITTTGYSNAPVGMSLSNTIGNSTMFLIVALTIVGGGIGSTAGGVKQYRIAVMCKSFYWSMKNKGSSKRMVYPHYIWRCGEHKEVTGADSIEAYSFGALYMVILLVGAGIITLLETSNGVTYGDSLFEFANAISSAGLTCGLTSIASVGTKWVLIVGMFACRLEFIPIYFAFFRVGRDILRKETI